MYKVILFLSILGITACSKDNHCNPQANPSCVCNEIYDPVCGCDDKTYSNSCFAECNNVKEYTKGECASKRCNPVLNEDCFCPQVFNPVCGCDNRTYGNMCEASCNNVSASLGACVYNKAPFYGTWEFLGYVSDGAKFKNPTKSHKYEMYLVFEENIMEGYNVGGKSATNFLAGKFDITNLNQMLIETTLTTKIACHAEACVEEDRFIDHLNTQCQYLIEDDYLKITSNIYRPDGLSYKEELLIFKKK